MLTRRKFLQATGAGVAISSQMSLAGNKPFRDPFLAFDGIGLASLVKSGQVSAKELAEASIRRIEALDGTLNAVVTRTFEQAIDRAVNQKADGAFAGVPFLIKDGVDYKGVRKTLGSKFFKDYISPDSPNLVKTYEALGLNIVGKSNMPELGLLPTTESTLLGACRNPWNIHHSTGGSSGGAAASVAAGYVPFAHASDGGGSIRIPASCCGVFGLKPSRGRMLADRLNGKLPKFRAPHCVSRSVRDSALLLSLSQDRTSNAALSPIRYVAASSERRLKIGINTKNYHGNEPDPEVKRAIEDTAKLCEGLGHQIIDLGNPINGGEFEHHYLALFSHKLIQLRAYIEKTTGKPIAELGVLERFTNDFINQGAARPADGLDKAELYLLTLEAQMKEWMRPVDVLLTPVLASPPVKLGYLHADLEYEVLSRRIYDYLSYTPVQNALGMPAMSVPLGMTSSGLPIGSHFISRVGDEETLLELAYELETALPWRNKWAPFSAKNI